MVYLLLAILCSAIIPNIFRLGKQKIVNEPVVITTNYILASFVFLISAIILGQIGLLTQFSELQTIEQNSILIAILLGIVTGVLYYGGFYFYQRAVYLSGPSLASAFGKMGILIPMFLSILLWKEVPDFIQWIGVTFALLAIIIIAINPKTLKFNDIHPALIIFFLIGGLGDFANKVFQKYCLLEHNTIFLFFVFFTALIVSIKATKAVSNKKNWDYIIGLMIGVPNLLTSYFLIQALSVIDAVIVFPIFSGGTIILASIISAIAFKEQLKAKEYIGIILMVMAVALISI
ncbi:MAG: SMR family transporter [Vulcanibacillus sp.]